MKRSVSPIDFERTEPHIIHAYTRVLHRLPPEHPSQHDILSKIDMTRAGFNGECHVDRFLKQVNFTEPYAILKEVNLKSESHSFISIDTLIITQSYICVLEIKTIKGILKFQSNPPQLLKDVDRVITPLKCPEQQLNRNVKRLNKWLEKYGISLPIHSYIVLPYSKTHVALPPKFAKIIMGCDISSYIEELNEYLPIISRETFDKLVSLINECQTSYFPPPLSYRYPIKYDHIQKGLLCSFCFTTIKEEKKCPSCKKSTKHAKKEAVEDWFYLWKDSITTRECMEFIGLNEDAASYLLRRLNLVPVGNGRGRKYFWKSWLV